MKRKVLFLTLAMAVVLTACGGNADKETSSNTDVNATEDTSSTDDTAADDDAAADTDAAGDDAAADTAGTEDADAADTEAEAEGGEEAAAGKYAKGTVTETGWESEFFGLRYTTPEGMSMSTEEELNDLMGLGQDDFSELQLKYAELTSVYEMRSVADDQTTNVVVTVEKLMAKMDVSKYVEALEQGLSQVSAINYTLVSDTDTVKIGDGEYTKVSYEAESSGVSMFQDYYVRIVDDRAIAITLTYVDESARDNVVNAFSAF